jgi:hypothetical protein
MSKSLKSTSIMLILFQVFCCDVSAAEESQPVILELEQLTLNIFISRTAHLFHIVDQLSEWSEFCHSQYAKDFIHRKGDYSALDRRMLEKHILIRKALPWGSGLEQTFYTTLDLTDAVQEGIRKKHITFEQGKTEIEVFDHFEPYVDQLIDSERTHLDAFIKTLLERKDRLEDISKKMSLFCNDVHPEVPFFILANPSDRYIGGGYNGKRLTLEIPRKRDSFNSLLHELMHVFVGTQRKELEKIVKVTEGLDYMTLNEGIAYALSPGIFHSRSHDEDPLLDRVKTDIENGKSLQTNYSTRFNQLGLALRPLLIDAFEKKQPVTAFLPRARDAWWVINEFNYSSKESRKVRGWYSLGPGWKTLAKVKNSRGVDILYGNNHTEEGYKRTLERALPGSTIILCFALDHWDKNIPERYRYLLPKPWKDIELMLKEGHVVEHSHEYDGFHVVLLAAPDLLKLNELMLETEHLKKSQP